MRTVYFDLDGCLAKYDYGLYIPKSESETPLYLQLGAHVFRHLEAMESMLKAFNILYEKYKNNKDIQFKIMTGIPVGLLQAEHTIDKYLWCTYMIRNFDSQDFFCVSVPKHEAVSDYLWDLTENDILIDDYPKNLDNWRKHGGTAIKCLNGINSFDANYDYIEASWSVEEIIDKIEEIIQCEYL